MGMTLIRSSFAEQIIEKYSILGSYEFGWNSLVFYREGAGQGERASSTYNTELTLKLLLMMQNYKQAGAHTAVNWNLISQTILKHMTGVSGGTERVIREMVRATFTGTERERFLRESITGIKQERFREVLREHFSETEREHIFRELTQEHLTEADRERIFRELTRENLTKTERERIFHELTRESLTDAERERIVQEMLRESLAESEKERIFREVSSGMDRESVYNLAWMLWKEDGAETGGKRGQIPGQRFQKMHLSSYRTISSIQRERARLILSRFRVQQIGREHISRWMELMSESETRQMIGDLKRFTEYYKIQKNRENSREEYSIFQTQNDRWELFEEQLVLLLHKEQSTVELKENFIRLWQEEPEILTALFERILKEETILSSSIKTEHIHGLFRKYEEEVFQKTEQDLRKENIRRWEEQTLFRGVETVLDLVSIRPEAAKKAGRELAELLKTVTGTQWYGQKETELLKLSEDMVMVLRENPEVLKQLQEVIHRSDDVYRTQIKEWVQKQLQTIEPITYTKWDQEAFLRVFHSDRQMEQERRELVLQVRRELGNDAADRLEEYFSRRERVTERVFRHQTAAHVDEQVKNIVNSYLSITRQEQTMTELNPVNEILLHNRVRETVHEPGERDVLETRQRVETMMRLVRNSYTFSQNRIQVSRDFRRQINEFAQRGLLGREISEYTRRGFFDRVMDYRTAGELQIPIQTRDQAQLQMPIQTRDQAQPPVYRMAAQAREAVPEAAEWEEARTQVLKKQSRQEQELNETKTVLKKINEKVEIQERLMTELKKKTDQITGISPVGVEQLTRQVMKKMESELRLEKMRRGLL